MILDHHNLFIYIDKRYLMFYHDINIICHSTIYWKCCQNFTHDDEYFEYLLKDLKYLGEKMFIVCKIGRWELLLDVMAWCCPNLQHWITHVVWNPCGIRNWWTLKKTKMLTEKKKKKIIQNRIFWIFSKLGLSSPTTCIDIIWTSHIWGHRGTQP
jgi:hypothetical protein